MDDRDGLQVMAKPIRPGDLNRLKINIKTYMDG